MKTTFNNIADFKSSLASDADLKIAIESDPISTLNKIQQSPLDSDIWIYRIVVTALGTSILLIIIGVILLIASGKVSDDKSIPTILTALGSAAIGALAGLLAPSPKNTK